MNDCAGITTPHHAEVLQGSPAIVCYPLLVRNTIDTATESIRSLFPYRPLARSGTLTALEGL
jgi:hypothetical protein